VKFDITISKPSELAVRLRIPVWAEGASVSVNGKAVPASEASGSFAVIRRLWKSGDRIELNLPMRLRLEAIDAQHPKTVAVLCGPLVLFAITDAAPGVTARQLLAAKRTGVQSWQVESDGGLMSLLPFTAIEDQQYSTYLVVS